MIRDFSESAKQKLLAYVKDVTETTVWGKLGDIIGDIGLQVQHWFGALDISKHVNNLDEYHKKVIDKNDTTSQRIEEIFTNVKNIDIRYQNGLGQELSYANSITDMIKVLSDTIDPNGGNMNLQKMNEALAASLEKIRENQLSKNKVIEDSMLGTDPDAAEMSADPVNLSTGNFVYDHQDLIVGGEIPLVFYRYYNSKDTKAVVKAQYNNARSSSSRAKYWNRLEKIKLQKTLGTIKYGIIETGKTIIDEIKNEIYRDEVNEDIVEEIDKKISCSVY